MAKAYRVKVRSGRTKSRIPKGSTSSSNPTVSRFRDMAKAQRDARRQPLVAVDDRIEAGGVGDEELMANLPLNSMSLDGADNKSMVSEGGMSRLTAFTNCTNPTFAAVHRQWTSGSHLHTDVVAVLASVAESIKEGGGAESDVEYFVGIQAIIERMPLEESGKLAAASYLFYLVLKKMSKQYLADKFAYTCQVLITKISQMEGQNDAVAVKFLLLALGALLRVQPAKVWKQSNARNAILLVMVFSIHDQAAVRTISRRVVRGVLTDPVTCTDSGIHPAAKSAGEKLLHDLTNETNPVVLTRMLCLLEGILHKQPESTFSLIASQVLDLVTRADPMVRCAALQCIHRTLQRQPSDHSLSVQSNTKMMEILRTFAVPADTAVCAYWIQAYVECHVCLAAKNAAANDDALTQSLESIVRAYHNANQALGESVRSAVARLIQRCIQQNERNAAKCLQCLDLSLLPSNTEVWPLVFANIADLFQEAGPAALGPVFDATLQTLAELRERDTAPGKTHSFCSAEIEAVFGAAIEHVDLKRVLDTVPLQLDMAAPVLSTDFKRSWLLLVLKRFVKRAPIEVFAKLFLPLAISIHSRCARLEGVTKKLYTVIEHQLWDLLPGFLNCPTDFDTSIHTLAPILGAALNERADLRLKVLAGIRSVLKYVSGPEATDERVEVVRRYSKNFLPILFLLYTTETQSGDNASLVSHREVQLSALETIRLYFPFVPIELVSKYCDAAIQKVSDEANTAERKLLLLDVIVAICKVTDADHSLKILELIRPLFTVKVNRHSPQKKAYRVLSELYHRMGEDAMKPFFTRAQPFVEDLLVNGADSVAPSSWAARLTVFKSIFGSVKSFDECQRISGLLFDQIVMCLDKSRSQAVRQNAIKCFQDLVSSLLFHAQDNELAHAQILDDLVNKVFTFADITKRSEDQPVERVRASLIASNVLAQKYLKEMNASLTARFLNNAFVFLKDRRSPIRVLTLRLIRVFCKKTPHFTLVHYQDLILDNVFNSQTADDNTVGVRRANKVLFTLLLEMFGFEALCKHANKQQGWVKFLRRLEKVRRRKAGVSLDGLGPSSTVNGEEDAMTTVTESRTIKADSIFNLLDDSDDEKEEETHDASERRSTVWIREKAEDDEDDVVDLLDRKSVLNRIVMEKPGENTRAAHHDTKDANRGFRFAQDGRFIVDEDEEIQKKTKKDELDDSDSDDEDVEMEETQKSRVSMRSKSVVGSEVALDYKTGGKGIHRNLKGTLKGGVSKKTDKKKENKFEPYAYIPLRQKHGRKLGIKSVVKNRRKGQS